MLATLLAIQGSSTIAIASENTVYAAEEVSTEAIVISFDQKYATVGQALTVTVTEGESEVTISGYEWYVNDKLVSTSSSYTPTEKDLESMIRVDTRVGNETYSASMYCSKLPVVYIDTENGAKIESKDYYIKGSMKMQGNDQYNNDKELFNGEIEIKGRGNTTWGMPKKPYKIKLKKKSNILGMGKQKHWVLLANYSDESLMRNKLAYDLSGAMGMPQMESTWVDVVLNGEYVGNYQLCEQIRVGETRIDVYDWENFAEDCAATIATAEGMSEDQAGDLEDYMKEESMDWITSGKFTFEGREYRISDYSSIKIPDITGGYLLELDEYYDEVSKFKTESGQPIMFKAPEFIATNATMLQYVQDYVQAFEDAVQAVTYTVNYQGETKHYSELYDMDALVDYWLINEIFFNEEFNKKSTYMYKEVGELMKMGPMWDMDYSSGGEGETYQTRAWATTYFSRNAQAKMWYKYLISDPYFVLKAQERYWEIRNTYVQDMLESIDTNYEYIKESGKLNSSMWTYKQTFDEDVSSLKSWFATHLAWLDEQFATENSVFSNLFGGGWTQTYEYFSYGYMYNWNNTSTLTVTNTDNSALSPDTVAKAPASVVLEQNHGANLQIQWDKESSVTVYVNGKQYRTVALNNGSGVCALDQSVLNAEVGKKNIIEVKASDGKSVQSNFVTIRTVEQTACSHTNTDKELNPATQTANGSIKEICLECGETLNTINIPAIGEITLSDTEFVYSGQVQKPEVIVKDVEGTVLGLDAYSTEYIGNCKDPGNYQVRLTFYNNYSGTVVKNFKITKCACQDTTVRIEKATTSKDGKRVTVCNQCQKETETVIYAASDLSLSTTRYTYDGKAKKPSVTLKDRMGNVIDSANYRITYPSGCVNPGTYTVKVEMVGNDYTGTITESFTIQKQTITSSKVTLSTTSYTYNGSEKKPSVTVRNSNGEKISSSHYTVTYQSGRKNVGTYKVTVKMKGNYYTGTVTKTFTIKKQTITDSKVKLSTTSYTYNGSTKKPSVTVYNSSGKKINSMYYTVTYQSGRKSVGTYKVTVKMKGAFYTGTVTKTFTIKPKSTSISSVTKGSQSLTVKWKKQSTQVTGFQVQYSTSSKFTSATTKTVSGSTKTSLKISKLKGNKKYYVRVRTYKTVKVNGKSTRIYSSWSSAKSATTKR